MSKVKVSDINATGTPSPSTYLRGDGSWATPSGGGGGGGGAVTLLEWNGAVDPPFNLSAALSLSDVKMLQINFTDVTLAASGWRTSEFSFDGGITWEIDVSSPNYSTTFPAAGNSGAPGSGGDSIWFIHSTASTAARSCQGVMWGLGFPGIKGYRTNRDQNGSHLNRATPTHVRVRGHAGGSATTNFTGGFISVVGYT